MKFSTGSRMNIQAFDSTVSIDFMEEQKDKLDMNNRMSMVPLK